MEQPKLNLNETKILYRYLKRGVPWWDLLVLGVLVWFDEWLIRVKTTEAVDEALVEYEKVSPSDEHVPPPVYSEVESDVEGLPEMRLEAPWRRL